MSAQFNRIPTHTQELPPGVLAFSPVEAKVLHFLLSQEDPEIWWPSKTFARRIGEKNTNRFRAILTNLADRNAIEACVGRGYRMLVADAKTQTGDQ